MGSTQHLSHVAIIMDGNGRWARKRAMPHLYGHRKGIDALKRACDAAIEFKVPYLTVYAFSTENWNRPTDEVNGIVGLLEEYLQKDIQELHDKGIRIRTIGDLTAFPLSLQNLIAKSVADTRHNSTLNLVIALNYGGRREITLAAQKIAMAVVAGKLQPDQISDEIFHHYLWDDDLPDPDLIIRTSGEQRLSNFLLWQSAYAELYFTPVLWPDFSKEHFKEALDFYTQRERRYGKLSANIA